MFWQVTADPTTVPGPIGKVAHNFVVTGQRRHLVGVYNRRRQSRCRLTRSRRSRCLFRSKCRLSDRSLRDWWTRGYCRRCRLRGDFLVAIVVCALCPGRPIADTGLPVEVQARCAAEHFLTTPKTCLVARAVTFYGAVAAGNAGLK